jgi:hypothetical protein
MFGGLRKHIDSIRQLRTVARQMIERMRDRKYQEEQERLAAELASRSPGTCPADALELRGTRT